MRMNIILASLCSLLVSCATFTGGSETSPESLSMEGSTAAPSLDFNVAPTELTDPGQATLEAQSTENQTAQASAMNEQRSESELDAVSEGTGADNFYATGQPAEIEQVVPNAETPSVLPEKQVASWSQHTRVAPSNEEPKKEKSSYKKTTKSSMKAAKATKHNKKKIAKNSKKTKKEIAKRSKKLTKSIAKKSKVDCKKIAKNTKKANKREIASCKVEKKKVATKSHKIGKVAKAGCQCDYR